MSGQLTQWFSQDMLMRAFNPDSYTSQYTTLKVVLTRTIPSLNDPSANLDRPTGGGYADVSVANSSSQWSVTGFREVYNVNTIVWPTITAYWGILNGWAVITNGPANQTVAVGRLTTPVRGNVGLTIQAAPASLIFGLVD